MHVLTVRMNISQGIQSSHIGIYSSVDGSSDRSFMVDPLSYFSFQPVFHDWCNKGRDVCYPVCGMVHIKEPLLLNERVAHVAAASFLNVCLT